jgi:sporulation protein YlmC with PRC-barrel domain
MNYEQRDTYGMYKVLAPVGSDVHNGPGPQLMGADTLVGNDVYNHKSEDLGEIKEIMLDMRSGRIGYAVLSFGGFLGMGEKLFAVPWSALTLDTEHKRFVLNVAKENLKDAPGFDKDDWPDMADRTWEQGIHDYYGTKPYLDDWRQFANPLKTGADRAS